MAVQREPSYRILVPSYDNSGNKIRPQHFIKHIDSLNKRFGGSTISTEKLGCWVDPKTDKPQCEVVHEISTSRDFDDPAIKKLESRAFEPPESASDVDKASAIAWQRQVMEEDWNVVRKVAKDIGEEFGQTEVFSDFTLHEEISKIPGFRQKKLRPEKVFAKRKLPRNIFSKRL